MYYFLIILTSYRYYTKFYLLAFDLMILDMISIILLLYASYREQITLYFYARNFYVGKQKLFFNQIRFLIRLACSCQFCQQNVNANKCFENYVFKQHLNLSNLEQTAPKRNDSFRFKTATGAVSV